MMWAEEGLLDGRLQPSVLRGGATTLAKLKKNGLASGVSIYCPYS